MIKQSIILSLLASAAFVAQPSVAQPKILGQRVTGVPGANPVVVSDTAVSNGFVLDLKQQGQDLPENPVGVITTSAVSMTAVGLCRIRTPI